MNVYALLYVLMSMSCASWLFGATVLESVRRLSVPELQRVLSRERVPGELHKPVPLSNVEGKSCFLNAVFQVFAAVRREGASGFRFFGCDQDSIWEACENLYQTCKVISRCDKPHGVQPTEFIAAVERHVPEVFSNLSGPVSSLREATGGSLLKLLTACYRNFASQPGASSYNPFVYTFVRDNREITTVAPIIVFPPEPGSRERVGGMSDVVKSMQQGRWAVFSRLAFSSSDIILEQWMHNNTEGLKLSRVPEILTFMPLAVDALSSTGKLKGFQLTFPETCFVAGYEQNGHRRNTDYSLLAVVYGYTGEGQQVGHAVACVRYGKNWFMADDTRIQRIACPAQRNPLAKFNAYPRLILYCKEIPSLVPSGTDVVFPPKRCMVCTTRGNSEQAKNVQPIPAQRRLVPLSGDDVAATMRCSTFLYALLRQLGVL